jgi:hypothetical protein
MFKRITSGGDVNALKQHGNSRTLSVKDMLSVLWTVE